MNQRRAQIFFQLILTLTIFSFWAAFALLIVNKLFYKNLPGYTIGKICIWELVAIIIAWLIAKMVINKWGTIKLQTIGNQIQLTLNPKYGIYFMIYFLIAIMIAVWQFWLFSQNY